MDREAEWLLEEKYNGEKTSGFFTDLERLVAGEPLGYVIGHVPFLGCRIYLDLPALHAQAWQAGSRPLIPRPETEFWVEKAIKVIKDNNGPIKVLDLCAGSGAIGVAVAKAIPESKVDFVEIDGSHHSTIFKNVEFNGIDRSRVGIMGGDLFEQVTDKYDFILTNPPYIDPVLDRTEASVKNFEPHLALYGGVAGMELIERIITEAPQYLSANGQLWIEHEPEQSESILEQASDIVATARTFPDQYGVQRYSVLRL